jgi:hypothetical protein
MSKKEKSTDQILRNRYTLALSIIACLVIFSQLAIQVSISKNEGDSRVINIAGRQRMLSQRITKCAYGIFISGNPGQRADYLAELVKSIDLWEKSHQGLQHGNAEMGLPGNNSGKIIGLFKKIQDRHSIILQAAKTIAFLASDGEPDSNLVRDEIRKITGNEGGFLSGMDTIVFQYDSEAKAKVKLVKQ